MSSPISPPAPNSDGLPAFANFLCQQRERITSLWMEAVRKNPRLTAADPLDHHALADHLPALFDDLADLLRGEPVGGQITRDAESHGEHRWQQDYSLAEVIQELSIVSGMVLQHGLDAFEDDHPEVPRSTLRRARQRILHFFENTAAGSVKQHVGKQHEEREDFHARLRASEQALVSVVQTERDRLADLFRRSPSFMAVVSGPEHVFEWTNERYQELVGDRNVLHRKVAEALPEVVAQGFVALLDQVYATGESYVANDACVLLQNASVERPDEHYVDFVYQPTHAPDGTIDGVFIHGVDRTDYRHAQKALASASEQRRLAMDSAQLGFWYLDPRRGTVQWDERFRAIFDLSGGEFTYQEVLARIHPDDQPQVEAGLAAASRPHDPIPYSVDYRIRHRNGALRWVTARGLAAFEGEGAERRVISLVGTVADVTETKAIRDALTDSETQFRQLADAMPQIVWTAQPDGVLDYTNQRWHEYIERTETEVAVTGWYLHVHPDDLPGTAAVWAHAVTTGQPYATEFRVRRADGEFRWFLVRALAIRDADGKILRWYGTCTDIHEQKQLQRQNEQLLESERAARTEAERISRVKDEFLATLSHELRTPLNAILGWTQVLRGDPANSEDVEAGLATIERNARAQNGIIEDLLDMSRIISGKVRLDVQRLDLPSVVEGAVETVRPAAEAKGIRLVPIIDPQARAISGDPNRLQQVFWNLLSNAIKFTPKGGQVQIVLERIHSHLEISISDSGEGIAPEFLPNVFDKFRQQDASTTRRHGGLGLGLAIVKQLVELHGGGVHVDSAGLGRGTTFRVMLPLVAIRPNDDFSDADHRPPQIESTPPSISLEALHLDGVRVLVVDDEADARALVKRLLEDRGATVRAAGSVAEALALLREEPPDVLVSDIGMPGEDGYALLRQVRTLPPEHGGNTPALALTAYARSEDRLKAIVAGFQMHLAKPVEALELLVLVANLAGRTQGGMAVPDHP